MLNSKQEDWRHIIQTLQREQVGWGTTFIIDDETRDQDEGNDYIEEWEKRASLNGKIQGLGSYGNYGRASSYPGQRNKRRQKVRTQVHAGQLEKVREEVPNKSKGGGEWPSRPTRNKVIFC